jgi:hypothetical protein
VEGGGAVAAAGSTTDPTTAGRRAVVLGLCVGLLLTLLLAIAGIGRLSRGAASA